MTRSLSGTPIGKWALRLILGAIALSAGISIYSRPSFEILYNPWVVNPGCLKEDNCLRLYILEIGNTGRETQESISIEVNNKWLEEPLLPPKAAMFGKLPRPMEQEIDEDRTVWTVGKLEPGKRIEIKFTLAAQTPEELPDWEDILVHAQEYLPSPGALRASEQRG